MSREVARTMGIPPDKLGNSQSLDQLGFDSLMAVELVVAIESLTGFSLPKMTLLQPGLTVSALAEIIVKQMAADKRGRAENLRKHAAGAKAPDSASVSPLQQPAVEAGTPQVNVSAMSDEEVDSLLSSLLSDRQEV